MEIPRVLNTIAKSQFLRCVYIYIFFKVKSIKIHDKNTPKCKKRSFNGHIFAFLHVKISLLDKYIYVYIYSVY